MATDTLQVWIADLAAYNEGHLHGRWVDATDADEMYEAAKEIIATSPATFAEEWAIHDYNGFPSAVVSELGEYASFETVANVATAIEEHGEAFEKWLSVQEHYELNDPSLGERFEEHYRGEWDSEEAYAMETACEIGWHNVPPVVFADRWGDHKIEVFDELSSYIDWETVAREMFRHGPYSFVDGYVFEEDW